MLKNPIIAVDLPLQGMGQLSLMLDIVKHEKEYSKKLKALQDQKKEILALIETVGKIESIDSLKQQIVGETEKLEAERQGIKVKQQEADDIVTQALTRSRTIESDAAGRARDQQSKLDQREKEFFENKKQFNERETELRKAEEKIRMTQLAVEAELSRLKQLQEAATNTLRDYEAKRAKVEKLLAGTET